MLCNASSKAHALSQWCLANDVSYPVKLLLSAAMKQTLSLNTVCFGVLTQSPRWAEICVWCIFFLHFFCPHRNKIPEESVALELFWRHLGKMCYSQTKGCIRIRPPSGYRDDISIKKLFNYSVNEIPHLSRMSYVHCDICYLDGSRTSVSWLHTKYPKGHRPACLEKVAETSKISLHQQKWRKMRVRNVEQR